MDVNVIFFNISYLQSQCQVNPISKRVHYEHSLKFVRSNNVIVMPHMARRLKLEFVFFVGLGCYIVYQNSIPNVHGLFQVCKHT